MSERIVSQEDRIRRAEEIYHRRRANGINNVRVSSRSVNKSKTKISLFKKMILQIAICAVIYIIFYLVKNTNYIFSEDVIGKTRQLLSYDINFISVYSNLNSLIEENKNIFQNLGIVQDKEEKNNVEEEKKDNANKADEVNNETKDSKVGGVGGAKIIEENSEKKNEKNKKTQMELDAEYIKSKYSFKLPLKGTITSRYGAREKTNIVSAYHYGIDIGAEKGTLIYAAMDGTVAVASSEGDYRKSY